MIDLNTLTLGEIDRIETLAGCSIDEIGETSQPKGKALAAVAFVMKRREELANGQEPRFTFNQALALTMGEANALLGISDDDDALDDAAATTEAVAAKPNPAEAGPTPEA